MGRSARITLTSRGSLTVYSLSTSHSTTSSTFSSFFNALSSKTLPTLHSALCFINKPSIKSFYIIIPPASELLILFTLFPGKDVSLGSIPAAVSLKWRALSAEERSRYEEMANADKARYDVEKAKRDEEFLMEQEERRKKNTMTFTDTRMRESTVRQ